MIDLFTAQKLDQEDVLAGFKNYFENNSNEIYLDGNSLGKLPKKTLGDEQLFLQITKMVDLILALFLNLKKKLLIYRYAKFLMKIF